jgi:Mn2+/Fe2+ NRAMP family transporter
VNRKDLMGEYVNSLSFNIVAWFISIAMIVITFLSIFAPSGG